MIVIDVKEALQGLWIFFTAEASPVIDTFDHALVKPNHNLLLMVGHDSTLKSVFVKSVRQLLARDQVLNVLLKVYLLNREPEL